MQEGTALVGSRRGALMKAKPYTFPRSPRPSILSGEARRHSVDYVCVLLAGEHIQYGARDDKGCSALCLRQGLFFSATFLLNLHAGSVL